jgi:hypothetical protein
MGIPTLDGSLTPFLDSYLCLPTKERFHSSWGESQTCSLPGDAQCNMVERAQLKNGKNA